MPRGRRLRFRDDGDPEAKLGRHGRLLARERRRRRALDFVRGILAPPIGVFCIWWAGSQLLAAEEVTRNSRHLGGCYLIVLAGLAMVGFGIFWLVRAVYPRR